MTWATVLSLAAGTWLIRATGLLLRGRFSVPPHAARLLDLGATALLVALVVVSTAGGGWARPAGVAVGALAAWRRLPFVLVAVLAAATTAGLRLAGVP
jgi:branched chain amino acid efflux pump